MKLGIVTTPEKEMYDKWQSHDYLVWKRKNQDLNLGCLAPEGKH